MASVSGFEEMADDLEDFGDGLDYVADNMDEVADNVAHYTAEYVVYWASVNAPVDKGVLKESIFISQILDNGQRLIVVAAPYGRYVEYGTAPHTIPPSPRTSYDHPIEHHGAEPNPFFRPAFHHGRQQMDRIFGKEMERLYREAYR